MTSPEWEAANEDDSDRFPQPSPHVAPAAPVDPLQSDPARVARYAEWAEVDERVSPLWKDATLRWKRRAEAAEAKLAKVEALHVEVDHTVGGNRLKHPVCAECAARMPCPTICALADAPDEQREPDCDMTEDGKHTDGGVDPDWNEQICGACHNTYEPAECDGRG